MKTADISSQQYATNANGQTNSNSSEYIQVTDACASITNDDPPLTEDEENNSIVEHEIVPGTPFYVNGNKEKGYILILKDAQLTTPLPTKEEVIKWVYEKPWELLIIVMTMVCDGYHVIKAENETLNQK